MQNNLDVIVYYHFIFKIHLDLFNIFHIFVFFKLNSMNFRKLFNTYFIFLFFILFTHIKLFSQSENQNYVQTIQLLEQVKKPLLVSTTSNASDYFRLYKNKENITYYDGLGKPKQKIAVKQGKNKNDIIQAIDYDQFNRISNQYLPLPSLQNTGEFSSSALTQTMSYYQSTYNDEYPYSQIDFDDSPLNRKREVSAPGNTWQINLNSDYDHTTKYEYHINSANEVRKISLNKDNEETPLNFNGYYFSNRLYKEIIKNENWQPSDGLLNTTEIFKDKGGKKIAIFTYEDNDGAIVKNSTYYVYDDYGNLRYVLPPKAINNIYPYGEIDEFFLGLDYDVFVPSSTQCTTSNMFQLIEKPGDFFEFHSHVFLNINAGAYLKQGNLYELPNNGTTMPDQILFKIYPEDAVAGSTWYEFSIKDGFLHNQLKNLNGTLPQPFLVYHIDETADLSFIKPSSILENSYIEKLAFQYKYDKYNRQIEQKVPGKDWEYMVYDQLDRPLLTQDPNMKENDEWLFNKYDKYGRIVLSGKYTNSLSREELQNEVDNHINSSSNKSNCVIRQNQSTTIGGVTVGYTNASSFPTNNLETLSVNYYDKYYYGDIDIPYIHNQILNQKITEDTKGLLTSTWTKVLTEEYSAWNKSYLYYDSKGRLIYEIDKNYLGGYNEIKNKLDFTGNIVFSVTNHRRKRNPFTPYPPMQTNLYLEPAEITITDRFIYDHAGRPIKHYQQIDEQEEELINFKVYNELGQLESKKIGGDVGNELPDRFKDLSNIIVEGNIIKGQANSWQSGLATRAEITDNGYLKYEIGQENKDIVVGFSYENLDTNYSTINYGIYTTANGQLKIYESGNLINNLSLYYSIGDIFEIERTGSTIRYKKNDELFYTSTIPSSGKIIGDISTSGSQAIIRNFEISSFYEDISNLSLKSYHTSQKIKKESGGTGWNAGLATVTTIKANQDGYLSYKVPQTNKYIMVGLSESNQNNHYNTIDFAIYTRNNRVYIYENGANKGSFGYYQKNDEFTIERIGSSIRYKKNGNTFYNSTVNSTSQLIGDMSFYQEDGAVYDVEIQNMESGLQSIDYTYNIRGWLNNYNNPNTLGNDLFAYNIKYDEPLEGTANVSEIYNGNPKQIIWKSALNNQKKSYSFQYDKLNRFKQSLYREGNNLTSGEGKYETFGVSYDPNGNIKHLTRHDNPSVIDDLYYTYDGGNQLTSIRDYTNNSNGFNDGNFPIYDPFLGSVFSKPDYVYDSNGNLIKDRNKKINKIEYNHLDLVEEVEFSSGHKIEFLYDANGVKLKRKNILPNGSSTTIDYLGGFHYANNSLQFFSTPEGYVAKDNGAYKYVYVLNDHLGNNRLSFSDINDNGDINPTNEILSNTDYYVMGLTHSEEYLAGIGSDYNYKFQNKEQLSFGEYNMYNFGSRMYSPDTGRWFNIDPQNQFMSPYIAMGNNHVISVDPNGEIAWFIPVIGAVVGGVSAALQDGANFRDIAYGAVVGAISSFAGASSGFAVASSTYSSLYGAMAGGAVGGVFSASSMAAYQGGNVEKAGIIGAFSGAMGGGIGSYIGGSVGAFTGGAASSSISSGLYGNFDLEQIATSGAFSVAAYNLSMFLSYDKSNGLSRKQFRVLSRESQIAFARGKERGGWLRTNGDIRVVRDSGTNNTVNLGSKTDGDIGTYHFHPDSGPFLAEPSFRVDMTPGNGLEIDYSLGKGADINLILTRKEYKSFIISMNRDIKYGLFNYNNDLAKFNYNLGDFYQATLKSNYFYDNYGLNLNLLKTFNSYNYLAR